MSPDEILTKALDARDKYFLKAKPLINDIEGKGYLVESGHNSLKKDKVNPSLTALASAFSYFLFELRRLGVSPSMRQLLAMRLQNPPPLLLQPSSASDGTGSSGSESHQDEAP